MSKVTRPSKQNIMKLSNSWIDKVTVTAKDPASRDEINPASTEVINRYRRLLDEGADPHEWAFAWRTELNRGGFPAYELLMEEIEKRGGRLLN